MRLDHWSVIDDGHLHGYVLGHPRHEDGTPVRTTKIVGRRGLLVITESGGVYQLLTVSPVYAALFPEPLARLLATLEEV